MIKTLLASCSVMVYFSALAEFESKIIQNNADNYVVRPLGFIEGRQPPTINTVSLDVRIGLSAQQVCGYTDWTTAAIDLPKKLLTKKYWDKIGSNFKAAAVDFALSVTHALPSMLACNVSPTFCNIMNQAQILAQFEAKFTFDACDALDGLANVEHLQSDGLRNCVQRKTNANDSTASEAREQCILEAGDFLQGKNQKAQNVANQVDSDENYNGKNFINSMCREQNINTYSSSPGAYSVAERSCQLIAGIPGIKIDASALVRNSGSYQSTAEKLYIEEKNKCANFIVGLVDLMRLIRFGLSPYDNQGPMPHARVVLHPDVQKKIGIYGNKNVWTLSVNVDPLRSCIANKPNRISFARKEVECRVESIPSIYRIGQEGVEPTLLISLSTLVELTDLLPNKSAYIAYEERGRFAHMIESLAQAAAYIRASDVVSMSLRKSVDACNTDPQLQSAVAQKDCKGRVELLREENEALQRRQETDHKLVQAQSIFYGQMDAAKREILTLNNSIPFSDPETNRVPNPKEVK